MLRSEVFDFDGRSLTKTWSDAGFLIRQVATGTMYGEAIDPTDMYRQYEETDIPEEEGDNLNDA